MKKLTVYSALLIGAFLFACKGPQEAPGTPGNSSPLSGMSVKRALLLLLAIVPLFGSSAQALETDKVAHAAVSYICNDLIHRVFRPTDAPILTNVATTGTCLFIGLVKESLDSMACGERTGQQCPLDGGDMGANLAGNAARTILRIGFEF